MPIHLCTVGSFIAPAAFQMQCQALEITGEKLVGETGQRLIFQVNGSIDGWGIWATRGKVL